jgi:hypothetical protein
VWTGGGDVVVEVDRTGVDWAGLWMMLAAMVVVVVVGGNGSWVMVRRITKQIAE